jgi:hypothetical protein
VLAARADDPIRVYYTGDDCGGSEIEVQAYDREARTWRSHPTHPRVTVPSCQVEEAGRLWNELRWRCAPWNGASDAGWRPLRVFDAGVMSHCAGDRLASGDHRTAITITQPPAENAQVRAPERVVLLRGHVDVDGRTGSDYDVVLIVDRGAPEDALEAQIAAARAFARGLAPRLGAVRVALLSYPSAQREGDSGRGARRDLGWSTDAAELDRTLTGLARRSVVSRSVLPEALEEAVGALADARPSARAVIVMGVDGARLDASG